MANRAAILGVGSVGPLRHHDTESDYLALAADALVSAAKDAGVGKAAVDGLVINSGGEAGPDYDQLANYLGLDLNMSLQSWAHGRFTASVIALGEALVSQGLADVVACLYARRLATDVVGGPGWKGWSEELRKGGGPHGENPRIGLTAPIGTAALATRLYTNRYGADRESLFDVVAASRKNSAYYPGALRPKSIEEKEYQTNPYVVEPLRRWDCTPRTEGAVCVIVGVPSAMDDPSRAINVLGFDGLPGGPEEFIWSRPGLGYSDQSMLDELAPDTTIFKRTGLSQSDVDIFFTYDPFSPLVWFAIERYGFCGPGEAPDFVRSNGLAFDQAFPTNPHGGSLSAGQLAGWLHMTEMVTQLRGEAGRRQVKDAKVAHYGACFGDSLVLGS